MKVDRLEVRIFPDRASAGSAAAGEAVRRIQAALKEKGSARIIVASAPSQNELLAGLTAAPGIAWEKVAVFHLDEYAGLPATHPASFRHYQEMHFLTRVKPAIFHGIRGESTDPWGECGRYAKLLAEGPIDLVCLGIGENGHIAFNDPAVADFGDKSKVRVVRLDQLCRQQQVHDGCFPNLEAVPREALTLTCPAIMTGKSLVCVVPGTRKAAAVAATLKGPIATSCPASILRTHPSATLFLDNDSAANL